MYLLNFYIKSQKGSDDIQVIILGDNLIITIYIFEYNIQSFIVPVKSDNTFQPDKTAEFQIELVEKFKI
jgi:hypothetical protein